MYFTHMTWIWAISLVKRTWDGKGDRAPDNGEGRINFFCFRHVAWGAPRWNLLLTARSPVAFTLPGAGWHDKLLYLIWGGIGCLLVIPLVPSGKRDSKSHRCRYSEIHSITPSPAAVWTPGQRALPPVWPLHFPLRSRPACCVWCLHEY